MTAPSFDTRFPPPWLRGDTWRQRAASVIDGFRAMPDQTALEGYAKFCTDIAFAPAEIRARVRRAYDARLRQLSPQEWIAA
jgi:hypothetical protein